MSFNPFTEDCKIDLLYPASQVSITINSDNSLINGFIEIAQGKGPHKTIILLHGIPGTEKNTDLAHFFRRAGYNVVIFSYRGSWGSKGSYSFKNCVLDVSNVVKYVQEHGATYRCDANNIIVIGYSLGGFLALYSAFIHKEIRRVASISGFFLHLTKYIFQEDTQHFELINELFKDSMNILVGTSPEQLMQEINTIDTWNFDKFYNIIADKDLYLVAGLKDNIVPAEYYHFPMLHELEKTNPDLNLTQTSFYDARHSYSDHRLKLQECLLDWLKKG